MIKSSINGIIFDLDQTIIDSEFGKIYRKSQNWFYVYSIIHQFKPYPGIIELIKYIENNNVNLAIVTSNHLEYCKRVLDLWNIPIKIVVASDNVNNLKPNPEPFIKVASLLKMNPCELISIGDQGKDILSSQKAHIKAIGALWGAKDIITLKESKPDFTCHSIKELERLLLKLIKIKVYRDRTPHH